MPVSPDAGPQQRPNPSPPPKVAFFSMEIAVEDALPTFSGGLGVLAGDFLKSAADLGLPVVAVTLLYRGGYFEQRVGEDGRQRERPVRWDPAQLLEALPERASVEIAGREVQMRAWRMRSTGCTGSPLVLYLIDTDLEENHPDDRSITDQLYSGDQEHRLRQEAVLGLGGPAMLRALGEEPELFHLNEGHCALLPLGLLGSAPTEGSSWRDSLESVRRRCVFTTHTPVPAGHDRFEASLVEKVLGAGLLDLCSKLGCLRGGSLNMTELALELSSFANAVSRRHREVSREMFPSSAIASITNGVHVATWVSNAIKELFDRELPGWQSDNALLRYASSFDLDELEAAHHESKQVLLRAVREATGRALDVDALTLGLARRAATYKRTTLLFADPGRLRSIVEARGPLQVLCGGKAHPRDKAGKRLISDLVAAAGRLRGVVEVVFLEGYDMALAKLLCAGTDVWLNTPEKPHEASGTSGMKAAVNGVPSLSVLDGWWIEGWLEGSTGWAVGDGPESEANADELYDKLESAIAPMFYTDPRRFATLRRNAISLNGSFFNTERMVREYVLSAYCAAR